MMLMMKSESSTIHQSKLIVRTCHKCGHANESEKELQRCQKCGKSFLPMVYARSAEAKTTKEYEELFLESEDISEDDLIKGLTVIWD